MVLARSNLLFPVTAWKKRHEKEVKVCFQAHHLETGLDGLDTARGVAGHALEEEQPGLLVEDGVRGPAGVAGHVLLDVTPQHVLYVLLLETSCK